MNNKKETKNHTKEVKVRKLLGNGTPKKYTAKQRHISNSTVCDRGFQSLKSLKPLKPLNRTEDR